MQSTLWLLAEKVLTLLLSFLVTTAVARHLMPESFGRLSFWLALASMTAPLMTLGLNSLISREVLRRPNDTDTILGSALALRLIAGLFIASVTSALAFFLLPISDAKLLSVLFFASVANGSLVIDFWLQAHVANGYAALLRLAVLVIFSVLRVTAVVFDAEVSSFIFLLAFEIVLLGGAYLATYQYLTAGMRNFRVSLDECRQLLKQSRWLFFSGIAAVLYLKIDQVMLGVLINDDAVGIYVVAAKFSEVWYFVPAALVTSYFPQLIRRQTTDKAGYALEIQKLNDLLFAIAFLVALLVTFSADALVPLLFGEAYSGAVPVLLVHIWAAILVFMRALLSKWLIAEDLLRLSFLSQVAGAITNIALNSYLIPQYGALGAAYATVVSYLVSGYAVLWLHRDLRPMAKMISLSLVLPIRFLIRGRRLYEVDAE